MQLTGKTCFLTGCASGIARHMAGVLYERGATLFLTDINLEALAAHAEQQGWDRARVHLHRLDVRDAAQWEEALDAATAAMGKLDYVMNIAGVSLGRYAHECTPKDIDFILDINAKGVIYGTCAAARRMVAAGGGHIINIASVAGFAPVPGMSLYCASKFAVRGFSMSILSELKPLNVAVSCICPDAVDTPMLHQEAHEPEAELSFSARKILTVHDVERAILKAMKDKTPEIIMPGGEPKLLFRIATAWPVQIMPLLPLFHKKGRAGQAAFKSKLTTKDTKEDTA